MGINRWLCRVLVYVALMCDEYPPFRLDQGQEEPDEVQTVPSAAYLGTSCIPVAGGLISVEGASR
jgi:hypothetical protein